jgi:hypothetical protein
VRGNDESNNTESTQKAFSTLIVHEFHTASSLVEELLNASILPTEIIDALTTYTLGQVFVFGVVTADNVTASQQRTPGVPAQLATE